KLIQTILEDSNISNAEINLVFGTDEMLRELKLEYFDEDVFTDVIAFRLDDGKQLEGEIYISPQMAAENAKTYGVSFSNELDRLLIHGTLHLLGWKDDTAEQKKVMSREENRFLTEINVTTLIN
ncbi:MAG TPA: rRNA maturation RNase YbeY, partial [Candidatus Marinimicrobia bacterium]|nr:rRNA maturation RNase YbeY [Candidatus Neomarinimicrobiota bacterium]